MTTPEPSVPVQPAVRRARWPWIAAAVAVLVAAGAVGIAVALSSGGAEPSAASSPSASPTAAAAAVSAQQIECVNIRRAYQAWDTATRPRTVVDFAELTEAQLGWLMEDADEFAREVRGYDSQASKALSVAVAEYNYQLSLANTMVVLGGGMSYEQAQALEEAAAAVTRDYTAWERLTCS